MTWPGRRSLEVDPEVYAHAGDPYQLWESVYAIAPEILAPVRQHIRDDVLGGHASLFARSPTTRPRTRCRWGPRSACWPQRGRCSSATRLWQRDMYEHYQLGGGSPAKEAL